MWRHGRAVTGIAVTILGAKPRRTALAVLGIAIAILTALLLISIGSGVVDAGQAKYSATGRDLWVSGGPIEFTPGGVGGLTTPIEEAHARSTELQTRPAVETATPMAFQTVYAGTTPRNLTTLVGVGVPGDSLAVTTTAGQYFTRGDVHYQNGSYTGPMTQTAVIDPRTANQLNVSVGDTLYLGGTVTTARQQTFHVIGISSAFGGFLTTPTVALHLSELQTVTGTTQRDPATMIGLTLTPAADTHTVERRLSQQYPRYDIRTNREQLQLALERQATVIASGVVLLVLAVGAGFTLTLTVFAHFLVLERELIAVIHALGVSRQLLVGLTTIQGAILGLVGGLFGVILTLPAVHLLNWMITRLLGVQPFLQTSQWLLVIGVGLATAVGFGGSLVAGWWITHVESISTEPPIPKL